jgi:Sortase and related acyltransferases
MPSAMTYDAFPAPDGPLRYALIPWDSETFGFPFIELRCAGVDHELAAQHLPALLESLDARSQRPMLVLTKIPVAATRLAELLTACGFYPVETAVEPHMALSRFRSVVERPAGGMTLRDAREADMPRLVELARGSFRADRLHVDANLPSDKADERFVRWVINGVRDGDMVFCYDDARGKTIGFYHVRATASGTVDLSLAALDRAYQKLGIGLLMYQAVLLECRNRGFSLAETHVTVHNLDVLNLFARLGFQFRNPTLTLHRYSS